MSLRRLSPRFCTFNVSHFQEHTPLRASIQSLVVAPLPTSFRSTRTFAHKSFLNLNPTLTWKRNCSSSSSSSPPRPSFPGSGTQSRWKYKRIFAALGIFGLSAIGGYEAMYWYKSEKEKSLRVEKQVSLLAERLGNNAHSVRFYNLTAGPVSEYHINSVAANPESEDRHTERTYPTDSFFGVYDGHSGSAAAQYAADNLYNYVDYSIHKLKVAQLNFLNALLGNNPAKQDFLLWVNEHPNNRGALQEIEKFISSNYSLATEKARWLWQAEQLFDTQKAIQTCLDIGFELADNMFLYSRFFVNNGRQDLEDAYSGACLLVAYLLGERLFVANAGDCRAVLGRCQNTTTTMTQSENNATSSSSSTTGTNTNETPKQKWVAVPLSKDHGIENPDEKKRLVEEHPDEPDIILHDRVKGMLQPTRGLGDGLYKSPIFNQALLQKLPNWKPPYTTVRPDITVMDLTPDDQFIVLATDGLWDFFTNEEVVEMVGEYLDKMQDKENSNRVQAAHEGKEFLNPNLNSNLTSTSISTSNTTTNTSTNPILAKLKKEKKLNLNSAVTALADQNASTYLIAKVLEKAAEPHAQGNSFEERIMWSLKLPKQHRRNFYDDITVTVVFLGPRTKASAQQTVTQVTEEEKEKVAKEKDNARKQVDLTKQEFETGYMRMVAHQQTQREGEGVGGGMAAKL